MAKLTRALRHWQSDPSGPDHLAIVQSADGQSATLRLLSKAAADAAVDVFVATAEKIEIGYGEGGDAHDDVEPYKGDMAIMHGVTDVEISLTDCTDVPPAMDAAEAAATTETTVWYFPSKLEEREFVDLTAFDGMPIESETAEAGERSMCAPHTIPAPAFIFFKGGSRPTWGGGSAARERQARRSREPTPLTPSSLCRSARRSRC